METENKNKKRQYKKRKANEISTDLSSITEEKNETQPKPRKKRTRVLSYRTQQTHPTGLILSKVLQPWPTLTHEWNNNTIWIDEAGMGCWAGPLYVAGTILLPGFNIEGIHDSKLLKEHERDKIFDQLMESKHLLFHVERISNVEIDEMCLGNAWRHGIRKVIEKLSEKCSTITQVVLDGDKNVTGTQIPVKPITKADRLYAGVAAASILAKVSRDREMMNLAPNYPDFKEIFSDGKGYCHSKHHSDLIKSGKYTDIHRKSFKPLKNYLHHEKMISRVLLKDKISPIKTIE